MSGGAAKKKKKCQELLKDNYITLIFSYNTKINTTFEKISTNHKEYMPQISQLGFYINTNHSKFNSGDDIGRSQYTVQGGG